jgi:hypothetical protein
MSRARQRAFTDPKRECDGAGFVPTPLRRGRSQAAPCAGLALADDDIVVGDSGIGCIGEWRGPLDQIEVRTCPNHMDVYTVRRLLGAWI